MNQSHDSITRSVVVQCPPERAFARFTEDIGSWWPLATHGVFPDEDSSVGFEGGALVERTADGRSDIWGEVLTSEPPRELSFTWHPGRPEGPDTVVLVSFEATGSGAKVTIEHMGWEVFGDDANERRSGYAATEGWAMVAHRFADFSDSEQAKTG